MAEPEAAVLARYVRHRDADAFRSLVLAHQHMVFGACRRVLGNVADAEDAAQSAFLKLSQKAGGLRAPIAGWLHRVAVTGAIDLRRQRRSRVAHERAAGQIKAPTLDQTWEDVRPSVDAALAGLPEELRVPLVLYYLEQRTQREVAEEIDVSQPAVSARLKRGVAALRKELRKAGFTVSGVALLGVLSGRMAEAAPHALSAALGTMAMAGVSGTGTAAGGAAAGIAWWHVAAGVTGLAAVVAALGVVSALAVSRPAPAAPTEPLIVTMQAGVDEAPADAPVAQTDAAWEDRYYTGSAQPVLLGGSAGETMFIDFDTGRLHPMPTDLAELDAMLAWMRANGADALYLRATEGNALIGADMAVGRASKTAWDDADWQAGLAAQLGAKVRARSFARMAWQGALPATFAFRTREGGLGLEQVIARETDGVRIRHKLLATGR